MHPTDLIHRPPVDWPSRPVPTRPAFAPSYHELIGPVRNAILRARRLLESKQQSDGSWLMPRPGDASLAPQLVLLLAFTEQEDSELAEQASDAIRADQRSDGTWSRTPDGLPDVSTSVAAYFALKLVGEPATLPHMAQARAAIRALGGADAVDASTRLWLALLGQISYEYCEPVAPEWLLLPEVWQDRVVGRRLSAAERRERTATSVVWSLRPQRELEIGRGVRELFLEPPELWLGHEESASHWTRAWAALSRCCERAGIVPFRQRSLALAEQLVARAALGAELREIGFAELAWLIVALHAAGFGADSPELAACNSRLEQLIEIDREGNARPMPKTSTVVDTLATIQTLAASGVPATQPHLANGAAWLVDRIATQPMGGLEHSDEFALLLSTLAELTSEPAVDGSLPPDIQLTRDRVARFLARRRNRELPRDDILALRDETRAALVGTLRSCSSAAGIGNALDALARYGMPTRDRTMIFGAAMLRTLQHADGRWSDDSDVDFVLATASAVRGLVAAGVVGDEATIAAGVNWLLIYQREDGDWGDMPQTCAAITALIAAGWTDDEATRRGIATLLQWHEQALNDGDVPADLRAVTAVLLTLSRWAIAATAANAAPARAQLRLVGEFSLIN